MGVPRTSSATASGSFLLRPFGSECRPVAMQVAGASVQLRTARPHPWDSCRHRPPNNRGSGPVATLATIRTWDHDMRRVPPLDSESSGTCKHQLAMRSSGAPMKAPKERADFRVFLLLGRLGCGRVGFCLYARRAIAHADTCHGAPGLSELGLRCSIAGECAVRLCHQ